MQSADLPRAIVSVFAGGMASNPVSQNISVLEVTPAIGCKRFPAELPPLNFVAVLIGGQPGKVYTSKLKLKMDTGSHVLSREIQGPDLPFTSQIKRANMGVGLNSFGKEKDLIVGPGTLRCELWISNELVAHAALEIAQVSES